MAASWSAARTNRSTRSTGRYYDLYTRQHGIDSNLFLAPGEGDKIPEVEAAPKVRGAAPPSAASLLGGGAV